MNLIENELARREKSSFKSRISQGIDNIKKDFKEKREFKKELKSTEKQAYTQGLKKEAKRYGSYRAKERYAKKKQGKGLKFALPKSSTPDFMKLPKGKEKNVFDW